MRFSSCTAMSNRQRALVARRQRDGDLCVSRQSADRTSRRRIQPAVGARRESPPKPADNKSTTAVSPDTRHCSSTKTLTASVTPEANAQATGPQPDLGPIASSTAATTLGMATAADAAGMPRCKCDAVRKVQFACYVSARIIDRNIPRDEWHPFKQVGARQHGRQGGGDFAFITDAVSRSVDAALSIDACDAMANERPRRR